MFPFGRLREPLTGLRRADAVIVTGPATGKEASLETVLEVKRTVGSARVFVGSGVNPANVRRFLEAADGMIVGSSFKDLVAPAVPVSLERVEAIVSVARTVH